jgi:hypothetical protein
MSVSAAPHEVATAQPVRAGSILELASGSSDAFRDRVVVAVLSLVTLVIYTVLWWCFINREMADHGRAQGRHELGHDSTTSTLALFQERSLWCLDDGHDLSADPGGSTTARPRPDERSDRAHSRAGTQPRPPRPHAGRARLRLAHGARGQLATVVVNPEERTPGLPRPLGQQTSAAGGRTTCPRLKGSAAAPCFGACPGRPPRQR